MINTYWYNPIDGTVHMEDANADMMGWQRISATEYFHVIDGGTLPIIDQHHELRALAARRWDIEMQIQQLQSDLTEVNDKMWELEQTINKHETP